MRFVKAFIFRFLKLGLLLWVLGYVFFVISIFVASPEEPNAKTDVIIVLTGGEGRVAEGLSLLANGFSKNLFISGIHPSVERSEILSQYTVQKPALPSCCIELGYMATTTLENAVEVQAWLAEHPEIKTVRMITSDYHMMRASIVLSDALEGIALVHHPVPSTGLFKTLKLSMIEYNKILFRLTKIWIL